VPKSRSLQWAALVLSAGIPPSSSRIERPRTQSADTWRGIMKLPHRRQFLHLAAGAAALPAMARAARAQAYPARPVRIIAGFPAGAGVDFTARLIGEWLSERLGQQFIIDNRPGASGNIGTEAVVKAPADGHTLLLATIPNAVNATLYEKLHPRHRAGWRHHPRASGHSCTSISSGEDHP
jgi:hypothetical protein